MVDISVISITGTLLGSSLLNGCSMISKVLDTSVLGVKFVYSSSAFSRTGLVLSAFRYEPDGSDHTIAFPLGDWRP